MKKIFCDKCKKEDYSISQIMGQKAILDYGDSCSAEIDLCDACRRELGKIIKEWLEK